MVSPKRRFSSTSHLLNWSRTMMTPASPYQWTALGTGACLAFTVQVADATTAQARMGRIGTDIFAYVPAAFAIGVFERRGDDLLVVVAECYGRGANEDEFQILAE